ncbi:MAG: hypothetical protein K0Q79_1789 [Flavipsychrobacter sp.]|jgi:uncharacterized protein with HEPN domain|nr:hypothetical protein [Flavipsychrobacter sp.]
MRVNRSFMKLEVLKWVQDIYDSVVLIESHLQNVSSLSDYSNNALVVDAVERRIAIIGEALWKADKMASSLDISDKKKIISLRHIVVHDYDIVEDADIWIICKKHLPILKAEVLAILNSEGDLQ